MQINSVSNVNFGKMGFVGKQWGRTKNKKLVNPYANKMDKLTARFKQEVKLIFNSYNNDKTAAFEEFSKLHSTFQDQLAIIERRKGCRGRVPLEY